MDNEYVVRSTYDIDPRLIEHLASIPIAPTTEQAASKPPIFSYTADTEQYIETLSLIGAAAIEINEELSNTLEMPLTGDSLPLMLIPGTCLNYVLRTLEYKLELNGRFLDYTHDALLAQAESILGISKNDADCMAISNLSQLLKELPGEAASTFPIIEVIAIDQKRISNYLERIVPHSPVASQADWTTALTFLLNQAVAETHPVYCLMDIVYYSLRAFVVEGNRITLKQCPFCNQLYYSTHGKQVYCTLENPDSPGKTCYENMAELRKAASKKNCRLKDKINETILKNGGYSSEARKKATSFRISCNKYKETLDNLPHLERYELIHDFLLKQYSQYSKSYSSPQESKNNSM